MSSRNRGIKKPSLRDLSRMLPSDEDRLLLKIDLLSKSPPLVRAVTGQALVESALDYLLRPRFTKRDDETWAELTDDRGPLSTFHRKIVTAHAFGICDDAIRDGLHTIRRIRNAFAHGKAPLSFDHPLIKRELSTLKAPANSPARIRVPYTTIRAFPKLTLDEEKDVMGTPTELAFVYLCIVVNGELHRKYRARALAWARRGKSADEKARRTSILDDLKLSPRARRLLRQESRIEHQKRQSQQPSPHKPRRSEAKRSRSPDNESG